MLPTWSVADVHESFEARSFLAAKEQAGADVDRLIALFDEYDIRAMEHRSALPRGRSCRRRGDRRVQPRVRRSRAARRVRLRIGVDRLPQRHRPGGTQRDRADRIPAASPPRTTRRLGWFVRPRRSRRGQRPGGRAPRTAQPAGRTGRPPDVGGRGAPLRRAVDHRCRCLGPAPAGGDVPVVGPRSTCPTASSASPSRRSAASPPIPSRPCAAPATTPSCRRGRLSRCLSPRR